MDRSLAARSPLARLTHPFGASSGRRGARPPRGTGGGRARASVGLTRPLQGIGGVARAGVAAVLGRRRARIALVALLIALPALAGGWLWLRHSPLASVQRVRVEGVHGPEAGAIEAALVDAARHMSTLDVSAGALRSAVASFPVVREVRASPSFPHGLRISVIEQLPVAALTANGSRTAVAADGVVLGPALLSSALPSLAGSYEPAVGQRVSGAALLAGLTVLGAAPAPLAGLATRVFTGPKGLTVAMRDGLLAYFGDATRPHAKWLSLARVLADSSSAGASYVDVRLPARPAAGFPPGVTPPAAGTTGASASAGEQASTSESAVAALAAGLTGGGETPSPAKGAPSSPSATEPSSPSTPSESAGSAPSEASSGAKAEGTESGSEPTG